VISGPPVTQGVQLLSLDASKNGWSARAEYRFFRSRKTATFSAHTHGGWPSTYDSAWHPHFG
jgi:hypothetical protein